MLPFNSSVTSFRGDSSVLTDLCDYYNTVVKPEQL